MITVLRLPSLPRQPPRTASRLLLASQHQGRGVIVLHLRCHPLVPVTRRAGESQGAGGRQPVALLSAKDAVENHWPEAFDAEPVAPHQRLITSQYGVLLALAARAPFNHQGSHRNRRCHSEHASQQQLAEPAANQQSAGQMSRVNQVGGWWGVRPVWILSDPCPSLPAIDATVVSGVEYACSGGNGRSRWIAIGNRSSGGEWPLWLTMENAFRKPRLLQPCPTPPHAAPEIVVSGKGGLGQQRLCCGQVRRTR